MPNLEHYCSWCKKLISTEISEDISEDTQTHGMCEQCELEQLKNRIPMMKLKLTEFRAKGLEELSESMETKLDGAQARVQELEDILYLEEDIDVDSDETNVPELHTTNTDEIEKVKSASFLLSKRATYADDVLAILEEATSGRLFPMAELKNLPHLAGINFPAIFYIVSRLESAGRSHVIGDAGNSFGLTQVHGPYFMSHLSRDPRSQKVSGISPQEFKQMSSTWKKAKKPIKNVWMRVPVNEDAVRAYMKKNPRSVLRRKEGVTIRYNPTNAPGIVKIKNGKLIGYAVNLNKLSKMGLNVNSVVINKLNKITKNFITWGVANSAMAKLFVAQANPVAYAKFQRTFNSYNIKRNPVLKGLLDSISVRDFMSKMRMVTADVKRYGYDTTAPGAYSIYQLAFTANGSGAGAVRNFLRNRRPFGRGNVHYIQSSRFMRAMRWMQRDPKVSPDVQRIARSLLSGLPSNAGMGGFSDKKVSSLYLSKRAEDDEDEMEFEEEIPTQPESTEDVNLLIKTRDEFISNLQALMNENETVRERVWSTLAEKSSNPDLRAEDITRLYVEDVMTYIMANFEELKKAKEQGTETNPFVDYMLSNWYIQLRSPRQDMTLRMTRELPEVESSNSFTVSKRASYAEPGTLYFPEQYAEGVKSGARSMTIRAQDVPVQPEEIVRCMTYSGGLICEVKITSKNAMSINRIGKAYGERVAKSLTEKFGPDKRFVVINFEQIDTLNAADDEGGEEKMSEVLIDKDKKLTRDQIKSHYEKPAIRKKIMSRIKDKPILVYIGTGTNEKVLKRSHNGKEIVITNDDPKNDENSNNYFYWVKRRTLSFHQVFGTETNLGFVDLDIHGDFSLSEAKKYAAALSEKIKEKYDSTSTIFESGGSGLHIEFKLSSEMSTDKLREELKDLLTELNKDWDNVTIGIVKGSGMRSDISTLHNAGSMRVPGSLGESHGNVKKSSGSEQDTMENNFNSGGFGKIYTHDIEEPFPDALIQVTPLQSVEPSGSYVAYNTVDDKMALSKRDIKKTAGQTYVHDEKSYSVDMLIEITSKNKIESIPVNTLEWNMDEEVWGKDESPKKHSPSAVLESPKKYSEDRDQIKKVDLKYPILIYKGEIIDGYHRLAKAVFEKKTKIKARIVTDKQLDATRIDKERIKELSSKSVLMLMAPNDSVVSEYGVSREVFVGKYGFAVSATNDPTTVVAKDYDALFISGGQNMVEFSKNTEAQKILKSFIRQKKPVAMIGYGPLLAVEAGLVRGRELTSWPDIVGKIRRAQGVWTGMPIERDGSLFTAMSPDESENIAHVLANFLNGTTNPERPKGFLDFKNADALLNNIWKVADLTDEEELEELIRQQQKDVEQGDEIEEEEVPELDLSPEKQREDALIKQKEFEEPSMEPIPVEPKAPKIKREKTKGFKDLILPDEEEELEDIPLDIESLETDEEFEKMIATKTEDLAAMFSEPMDFGEELNEVPLETDEEKDYETTMDKSPETIFGVKLKAPADEEGNALDQWPKEIRRPKMSSEARELFSPDNLKNGKSLTKLFQDPAAWDILHSEPQLLQSWILPSLIIGIGKSWFDNNSSRATLGTKKFKNVGKTPFGMFDEDDISMIADGVDITDLISGRKYIRMLNQLVTKYANYYFSYGYRQSEKDPKKALPLGGYIYKSINRAMTKEISEVKGYKQRRYPTCSVCFSKRKNSKMVMYSMKKVADKPMRWECPTCKRLYDEMRDIEIPTIEAEVSKKRKMLLGGKDSMGVEEKFRIAQQRLDVAETDEEKNEIQAKIATYLEAISGAKSAIEVLESKKSKIEKKQNILAGQMSVPYWHAWCPNVTCPGRKVPLTAIDWKSDIWAAPGGADLAEKINKQYGIEAPHNLKFGKGRYEVTGEESVEGETEGRKVTPGNVPPTWMLAVPFVCPHDDIKFTLGSTKYQGHRSLGGFLWEPYRRITWEKIEEAAPRGADEMEVVNQAAGVEEEMDSRLSKVLFAYLSVLGKRSLSRELDGKEEEFHAWIDKQIDRGYGRERILKSSNVRNKLREIELYRTVEETSTLDPLSFVSWLTETSIASKFVQDGQEDVGEDNFILKTNKAQRRDEIYIPILQSWTDSMLSKKNGFEHFGMEEILTDRKVDGIPSDGPGTFFIAKIGGDVLPPRSSKGQEGVFGFGCELRLAMKAGALPKTMAPEPDDPESEDFAEENLQDFEHIYSPLRPVRTPESSLRPRILRILGVWQLSEDQTKSLQGQVRKDESGQVVGKPGEEKLRGNLHLGKDEKLTQYARANSKDNIVGDISDHDFYRATLDKENTELSVGDYVLVQALMMPGAYKWKPITKIQELRRKSDTSKNIFGRLGALFSAEVGQEEDRILLQEFVRDVKEYGDDPKEMEMIVDDLIDRFEAKRGKKATSSIRLNKAELLDKILKSASFSISNRASY